MTPGNLRLRIKKILRVAIISLSFPLLFQGCSCLIEMPYLKDFTCQNDIDCLEPLLCYNGYCKVPCSNRGDCVAEEQCTNGFCQKVKITIKDDCPGEKEICNGIDDDCDGAIDEDLICVGEWEWCDPLVSPPRMCKNGLICAYFNPSLPQFCVEECNNHGDCSAGERCLSTLKDKKSGCVKRCEVKNKDSECPKRLSYLKYSCVDMGGNNTFCFPQMRQMEAGKIAPGNICDVGNQDFCRPGLSCVRTPEKMVGICTVRCGNDKDCEPLNSPKKTFVCEKLLLTPKEKAKYPRLQDLKYCLPKCSVDSDCEVEQECSNGVCFPLK